MLALRVIPCLDVKDGRVVKGVSFEGLRDVGDPVELAARYEAEGADEIVFLDISASAEGRRTLLDVVRRTAERLFTHRHTIRYRLERVKELTGLDVGSTDGRERLSLGLKAMRVLGIVPPGGPAHERGTEAGRVPRGAKDRSNCAVTSRPTWASPSRICT